jgi:hypothetical protein
MAETNVVVRNIANLKSTIAITVRKLSPNTCKTYRKDDMPEFVTTYGRSGPHIPYLETPLSMCITYPVERKLTKTQVEYVVLVAKSLPSGLKQTYTS